MDFVNNVVGAVSFVNAYGGLDGKIQTLKRKLEELTSRWADVSTELKQAERVPGKRRKMEVDNWLKSVEQLEQKVHKTEQDATEAGRIQRVLLVDRIKEQTREVEELFERGQFPEGLMLNVIKEPRGHVLPAPKLVGENFDLNLSKIWRCLMNRDDISNIGVHGMGGVGKTTLVGHIYDRLLRDKSLINSLCWVTVSQECTVNKIQNDLADCLGLDLSKARNEMERAQILSNSLASKRSVVIFDDIWKFYPIEKVGIPLAANNGCKLILTSRSKSVCDQMGCSELINVEVLSEEESWLLFKENLSPRVSLSKEVAEIAKLVAKECSGLPLGLTVLARCMRGVENMYEWKDALEELKESKLNYGDVEDEVFRVLRFSYDRLSDEMAKQCFLNIALYPEDHEIYRPVLIQYFMDVGLLSGRRNREAEFNRGQAVLEKLLAASLLQEGKMFAGRVKMHDLVRDMVINMMKVQFMVRANFRLTNLPDGGEWTEGLEKVSLMDNRIVEILPGVSPRCPKLHTLLLGSNPLEVISDDFFEHMPDLQVLDLSATIIKMLPSSACSLKKLIGLYLRECPELRHLPSLEKLTTLRTLDLRESGIQRAPEGMEKLINLRSLDFWDSRLGEFPAGILPQLTRLQCLHMACTATVVEAEELAQLKELETLCCRIPGVRGLNVLVKHMPKCLHQYNVTVDETPVSVDEFTWGRARAVLLFNCQVGEKALLPKDIQVLSIEAADHLKLSDLSLLPVDTFTELEVLLLERMGELRILVDMEEEALTAPSAAAAPPGIFSGLRHLEISRCPKMKKLLCQRLLAHLENLESVSVERCELMEEIIANEGDEEGRGDGGECHCQNEGGPAITHALPKLKCLTLRTLPKLRSICRGTLRLSSNSIAHIIICQCQKLWRMPMLLEEVHPIPDGQLSQRILPSSFRFSLDKRERDWWESIEWEHPDMRDLLQPYIHFD